MSLVFGSREVSVGPTVGFQGDVGSPTPAAYVSKHRLSLSSNSKLCNTISNGEEKDEQQRKRISCFSVDPSDFSNSSDNSSIDGLDSDTDDDDDQSRSTTENGEDDENEVRSKLKGSLSSMESLEDSLPIKRGLSNFFSGKSKSFANLSKATTVKSLQKRENPFNKRRRTLIACKWSRKGGFYSSMNPVSMPLLALNENEEDQQSDLDHEDHQKINNKTEDDDDDDDDSDNSDNSISYVSNRKIRSFKSSRCFSLTDLRDNIST